MSADRTSRPELMEDERGHDDCFDWKGPLATRGQVWVDAQTYDVLRIDRGLPGPVDVRVPARLQRRYNFGLYEPAIPDRGTGQGPVTPFQARKRTNSALI